MSAVPLSELPGASLAFGAFIHEIGDYINDHHTLFFLFMYF
jgi:hypothetical protein